MSISERLTRRLVRKTDRQVREIFATRRTAGEEVSSAHNESNLKNTAQLTQLVGRLYGFSPKELRLAYFAGSFHDIERSSREDGESRDEGNSAQISRNALARFRHRLVMWTDQEQADAVAYAIEHHGKAPDFFSSNNTREDTPANLSKRIHLALFVADKMTANGFDVLRRRSSFVAGERLHKPDGDLHEFGFKPERDELLVVAMESAIRLAFINPESIYPRRIREVVHPLYEIQREFVKGVYKLLKINNRDLAELLLGTGAYIDKMKDGQNIAEFRKLKIPEDIGTDVARLAEFLAEKTGITDEMIDTTPDDVAQGARETIEYFSSRYKTDLDELSENWEPQTSVAQRWQRGMHDMVQLQR